MRFFLCLPYCTTGSQAFGWLLEWEQTYESFPASFPHPIHGIFRTCSLNHHGSRLNRIALVGFSRSNHHSRPEQRYTEASSRNSKVEFMIMSQHIAIFFFNLVVTSCCCTVTGGWHHSFGLSNPIFPKAHHGHSRTNHRIRHHCWQCCTSRNHCEGDAPCCIHVHRSLWVFELFESARPHKSEIKLSTWNGHLWSKKLRSIPSAKGRSKLLRCLTSAPCSLSPVLWRAWLLLH